MSLENSKRLIGSLENTNGDLLDQRKRIRITEDAETQFKRKRSPSPDVQEKHLQTIPQAYQRPPIIPLRPNQRLELFKKRQRWRQSNFYNSRNHSSISARNSREPSLEIGGALITSKQSKSSSAYVEASTQTDSVPDLRSKGPDFKRLKQDHKSKVPAGKFSGEILYDSKEIDDANGISPVKFPESKTNQNRSVPVSSGTLNALLNDKKKFTQVEKPKDQEPVKLVQEPSKEPSVGPSAGFNFLNGKTKKIEEINDDNNEETKAPETKSTPLFSAGAPPPPSAERTFSFGNKSTEIKETSTPAFSFGSKVENKDTSKPAFSFGSGLDKKEPPSTASSGFSFGAKANDEKKEEPKPSFSFGKKSESNDEPVSKPSFSFGQTGESKPKPLFGSSDASADAPKESEAKPSLFGAKTDSAPSSFGGDKPKTDSAPSFSFGGAPKSSEESSKPEAPKPFSFGASAPSADEPKEKPAFSFGAKPTEEPAKPSFSFGSKPESSSTKPAFSFGAKPEEKDKPEAPKPAFSCGASTGSSLFGSQTTEKKDEDKKENAKPTFSFGAPKASSEEPSAQKPSFSFGSTDKPKESTESEKPKSLFGGAASGGFNFGGASTDEKAKSEESATKKSTFSFGDSAKPAFSFGTPSSKPDSSTPVTEKPAFSFGAAPAASTATSQENKPAFSFGAASQPSQENKPSFGFGASSSNTAAPAPAKPSLGFNFGGASDANKPAPASVFGASTAATNDSKPSSGFNFGGAGSTPTPASVFGGATGGAQASSTPFSFGSNAPAAANPSSVFGNNTPAAKPSFSTGSSVNFNFGGAPNNNPSTIFGSQPQGNNTPFAAPQAPSFGAPQQGAGGFGFGAAQAPAFGGAASSTPLGGAQAPGIPNFGTPAGTPSQPQQSRVPGRRIAQIRQRRR